MALAAFIGNNYSQRLLLSRLMLYAFWRPEAEATIRL
jgi:hypothetical protein